MSVLFGPIRQLGYVVSDVHEAMRHWSALGVGPFHFFAVAPIGDFRYLGERCEATIAFALGQSGPLQIELIMPLDDHPSLYSEFLDRHGSGLQHVAFWTRRFDADRERALGMGMREVLSGYTGDPSGRFAYLEAAVPLAGACIELSALSERKERLFARVAESSVGWDGDRPVRDGLQLLA